MPFLYTTAIAMHGGVTAASGVGSTASVVVTGTWTTSDTVSITLTNLISGIVETVGFGESAGKEPVFPLTFKKKMYALYDAIAAFSAVDNPILFNDLNGIGNGTLNVANSLGSTENLTAAAIYQSKLVLFSPNIIQLWTVNADASLYEEGQLFENIGTSAPNSVKALGTMDVLFLANTGVRSIRAREYTLDADTIDVGTPIDLLVTAEIDAGADEANACAAVEPRSKRYWLYLNTRLYVLSYFRGSKITAWTTYDMSYEKEFIPTAPPDSYNGSGQYTISGLIAGNEYLWNTLGANLTLTNGTEVITGVITATVTAQGTSVVISGGTPLDQVVAHFIGQKAFVPTIFEVSNDQVFTRSAENKVYSYGGTNGNTYDRVQAKIETPWLDDNTPMKNKRSASVDIGMMGKWLLKLGSNPTTGEIFQVLENGSATSPDANVDSTFDLLRFGMELTGTHFKISASSSSSSSEVARLSEFHLLYQEGETS